VWLPMRIATRTKIVGLPDALARSYAPIAFK
jgi:hypothetical protein